MYSKFFMLKAQRWFLFLLEYFGRLYQVVSWSVYNQTIIFGIYVRPSCNKLDYKLIIRSSIKTSSFVTID